MLNWANNFMINKIRSFILEKDNDKNIKKKVVLAINKSNKKGYKNNAC